jgi:urease accessory protein
LRDMFKKTSRISWSSLIALSVCALLAAPRLAFAHLVTTGVGPFYDGVAHLFVTPDDLIVVVALALFGGLSGRLAAKSLVLTLPAAWLVGSAIGLLFPGPTGSGWMTALSMLAAGLLTAINPKVPRYLPAGIAAVLGMMHGFLNGRAMASTGTSFLAAMGLVAAVSIVALFLSALAASLRISWMKIAARVIGSWAAAIGILALAWALRPVG